MKERSKLSGKIESLEPLEDEPLPFIEPWYCDECGTFVYNKDSDGYPAPGAPVGLAVKFDKKEMRICLVCAEMYIVLLKSPYMMEHHRQWLKEVKYKEKLRFCSNYLDK